ncbi:hypothetical protein C4573_06600 [Candidatus Woesearchaeota archaeon]|nr:MAG: hypothetical protein C4573_06600 [Candidatus Woesearchaeota archaeon]
MKKIITGIVVGLVGLYASGCTVNKEYEFDGTLKNSETGTIEKVTCERDHLEYEVFGESMHPDGLRLTVQKDDSTSIVLNVDNQKRIWRVKVEEAGKVYELPMKKYSPAQKDSLQVQVNQYLYRITEAKQASLDSVIQKTIDIMKR